MDDKRRYIRLKDNFRVTFRAAEGALPDSEAEDLSSPGAPVGFSKDLSVGGLCLVSDAPVQVGDFVVAELHAAELETPLAFAAQIVRADVLASGQRELALRFLPAGLDEESRQRLVELVYAQLRDGEA